MAVLASINPVHIYFTLLDPNVTCNNLSDQKQLFMSKCGKLDLSLIKSPGYVSLVKEYKDKTKAITSEFITASKAITKSCFDKLKHEC
jgi:hypothetical protein